MNFCSYDFMLNEVHINNDITRIANIVLNKASNSNDATHIRNKVHLTAVGTQQFSLAAI